MRKIKVAFCTDGVYPFALGGMQKHSRMLIDELSGYDDLEITVIHPHTEIVFDNPEIEEISLRCTNGGKNYVLECYNYSKRVYSAIMELNPDVIYSQGLSVWYGIKNLKKRTIVNPHGLEPYQAIGTREKIVTFPLRLALNNVIANSSVVISLGGWLSEILMRKCSRDGNVVVIPNGARDSFYQPKNENERREIRVLFLARFAKNKGISILFDAFDELQRRGLLDRFEFTLAGKGPLYNFYKSNNRHDNVQLTGFVPDGEIATLYKEHDLFLFPTLYEGMPTVVLEAMSFGLPIIVTDVGATRELVDDSNGKVISPNSVDELVESLKWFSELTFSHRKDLADSSLRKFRESFTWEKIAKRHHDLFKFLVATKST